MVAWAKRSAVRVSGDRKGATAVEYGLIASIAVAVVTVGFRSLFERMVAVLPTYLLN